MGQPALPKHQMRANFFLVVFLFHPANFESTLRGAVNEAKDSEALFRRARNKKKKSNILSHTRSASPAFLPWQLPELIPEGTLYIDTAFPRSLHDYIIYIHIHIVHSYSVEVRIPFCKSPSLNCRFCNVPPPSPPPPTHWSFEIKKKKDKKRKLLWVDVCSRVNKPVNTFRFYPNARTYTYTYTQHYLPFFLRSQRTTRRSRKSRLFSFTSRPNRCNWIKTGLGGKKKSPLLLILLPLL